MTLIFALIVAACSPAATPTPTQRPTEPPPTETPEVEAATEEATEAVTATEEATEAVVETEEATEAAAMTEEATEAAAEETAAVVAMATEEATEAAVMTEEATEAAAVALATEEATEEAVETEEATEAAAVTEEATEAVTPEPTEAAVMTEEATEVAAATEEATEAAAVEATEAPTGEEFVFGMVLVGPKNDRGWSQAHYEGGQYVEQNLPGARMLVFESLNPAAAPETTLLDVVTEMVDSGATLIFTTSDEFEEDTSAVARQFPDVIFVNVSGDDVFTGEAPDNLGNLMGTMEWGKLIAGCAAGLTTQTGQIGYLGPLINFETRRLAASAYLGARYCYEKYAGGNADDLQFTVTWIGFWFNIPGVTLDPTEVVNNFFDSGADVVISGIDTTEAIVVAGQRAQQGDQVWAVPYDFVGACDVAPDVCLGVPYFHWGPGYLDIVTAVQNGTYEPDFTLLNPDWADINNEETSAVGFVTGPALSEENQANLDAFIEELATFATDPANEDFVYLWVGPLAYQDGTVIAEEGEYLPYIAPLGEAPAAEATAEATAEAGAVAENASIWYLQQLLEGMTGPSNQE
ncbi:MAG: BMP family ABC transporter substrate-binding protein [Chloroflexi bacterium]|nr:BMP family ABC transporter substrate-binding protein [Chloroflexota bacterium]